ncbi:hypothetical protein M413DRAFT_444997 [Hebeloma cylindrosporum]|uniref:Uncharacterized protein n=1 Tax=Hebeloma cylindrosporum TaxID=76867 RepID=A0A0C3CBY7_HEBCY|nr:hypothetical protein M413DRAFT_444997 [Hebeloma cylindrosporum h7]
MSPGDPSIPEKRAYFTTPMMILSNAIVSVWFRAKQINSPTRALIQRELPLLGKKGTLLLFM